MNDVRIGLNGDAPLPAGSPRHLRDEPDQRDPSELVEYQPGAGPPGAPTGAPGEPDPTAPGTVPGTVPGTAPGGEEGPRSLVGGGRDVRTRALGALRRRLGRRARAMSDRALGALVALGVVAIAVVLAVGASVAVAELRGPPSVVVTTAAPATIASQPGGVGQLTATPSSSFTVSINLAGVQDAIITVTQVEVISGQHVNPGDPLLQVNPTLLIENLPQFQAQLGSAQAALATATAAPTTGAGSDAQALQVATLSRQVAFDSQLVAIAQGRTSVITAPMAGSVTGITVQPGQAVGAGQSILQIVDPTLVQVAASMQLTDLAAVAPGDPADIAPTGLPGVHLHGSVVTVSPITAPGGLQGTVVVQAENTAASPVPIGSQVFVHVSAATHAAVSVPLDAVMNSDTAPVVFVVDGAVVHVQPVTLGAADATRVAVVSGLAKGQRVAESGVQTLQDGDHVRVLDPSP